MAGHLEAHPAAEMIERELRGQGAWVRAHPPLLGQLLDNLLDNACKYGGSGMPILVRTCREGEEAVLAVEDAGPGLSPEDCTRVFEPFYRSAQARRLGIAGVGLGLAVVERIAVAFGGSVGVRSDPGSGCRFEVRLVAMQARGGSADGPRD